MPDQLKILAQFENGQKEKKGEWQKTTIREKRMSNSQIVLMLAVSLAAELRTKCQFYMSTALFVSAR